MLQLQLYNMVGNIEKVSNFELPPSHWNQIIRWVVSLFHGGAKFAIFNTSQAKGVRCKKMSPNCYGWDFWIMSLGVLYFLLEQKQGEGYKSTISPPIHGTHDTWWYTLFCIDEASSSSIRKSVIETLPSASQSSLHQRFCHNHFFVIVITMSPTHNISQWCTFF